MAFESQELCGPFYAKSLESDDYILSYVISNPEIDIRSDKYISTVLNGNRLVRKKSKGSL